MAEIRQAIFEKLHELEDDYAVRYSRGATLFIVTGQTPGSKWVLDSGADLPETWRVVEMM